jgi:hypothetical protein
MPSFRPKLETGENVSKLETWHPWSGLRLGSEKRQNGAFFQGALVGFASIERFLLYVNEFVLE